MDILINNFINNSDINTIILNNYVDSNNEKSNHEIFIGYDYSFLKEQDIDLLKSDFIQYIQSAYFTKQDFIEAKDVLINSFTSPNPNMSKAQIDAYESITENGSIKYCKANSTIKLCGVLQDKQVIDSGIYKCVKSKSITLAKNYIKKFLITSKIRYYTVDKYSTFEIIDDKIIITF